MNLHRSDSKPDWAGKSNERLNVWQKIAKGTNGLATPGNVTTVVGLGLVVVGLYLIVREQYWLAMALIVIGRLFDLVDGWLAEVTQTKSPLGEFMDATADKVGTILAIVVFYVAAVAPWLVLTALLLPHIWIAIIAYGARRSGIQLHPSRLGKISMALLWVALFGFILLQAFELTNNVLLLIAVYVISVGSVVASVYTAIGYIAHKT